MTTITVKALPKGKQEVSWPEDHPRNDDIERWLSNNLSPGYIEYLLLFGNDPHCSACRDAGCENVGMGDDACRGFKFGEEW